MKRTLIALAVLGAASGAAIAQSNVTIYGIVDTGYVKKTGEDLKMDSNLDNRIGFKAIEDLGGGLKATMNLEKRFNLNDGTNRSDHGKDWEGAANVGIKSDCWGAFVLGRVNELPTEAIRRFDPFDQDGVGAMIESTQRSEAIDNTIRYDSPTWNGFNAKASYSLGKNMNSSSRTIDHVLVDDTNHSRGYDNDGYALGLNYTNGGWDFTANYSVLADSNRSSVWNAGAAYSWDTVKVSLLYQMTRDKGAKEGDYSAWADGSTYHSPSLSGINWKEDGIANDYVQKQWLAGLEWKVGPGRLNASFQYVDAEFNGGKNLGDADIYKYAVGYTYDLSKRTSLYGIVAYSDWDDEGALGSQFAGNGAGQGIDQDKTTSFQVGITHKF